jgi:type IV pilus assembly protein PilE
MKKQKGFSLLELLVVISIMGILIALGTVAFATVQKKGRDSRRRADVKAMQDGFEQFYGANGVYATCDAMADYDTGTTNIMPGGLPVDPKNSGTYVYNTDSGCDATGYCVCSLMEASQGNADSPSGVTCDFTSASTYYCLTNLQ